MRMILKNIGNILVESMIDLHINNNGSVLRSHHRRFKIIYDGEFYFIKEKTFLFWCNVCEKRTYMANNKPNTVKFKTLEDAFEWLRDHYGQEAKNIMT